MVRTGLGFEVYLGLEVVVESSWKLPWSTVVEISQKRLSQDWRVRLEFKLEESEPQT